MTIRITVPFDAHRLSLNQRLHWRERHRRNQAVKEAARFAWMQAGCPRVAGPVRVSMVVRRGRSIDVDNAITGTKAARDALFCHAITEDDNPRFVTLGECRQEVGKAWKERPEVEFIVEPLSAPPAGDAPGGVGVNRP
jgi:Holliday junction resolvase RusA-like endonuclease